MIEAITTVTTYLVTLIFGFIAKKFDIIEGKYIPYQNLTIGVIVGILAYICHCYDDLITSVIFCLGASLTAGGTYDVIHTGKKDE